MTESSNFIFSHKFRMCNIFCQVWFPLCRVVFAAVEMGDSLGRDAAQINWETLKDIRFFNQQFSNFLVPIIEIAEVSWKTGEQSTFRSSFIKHGRLRDPRLTQRQIDARGDWRNRKKYPKFVRSRLVQSGQNLTWQLSKPKTLFGKRHGLGRFFKKETCLTWP